MSVRGVVPQGRLFDGTEFFAPIGQLLVDGDRVCCHLCGSWFLSVAPHLRVHGWSKAAYIDAFGLERGNALAGDATRKRRAAALTARAVVEPAIRTAQADAVARARSGALTAAAAAAARGRPHPPQRRVKTLATLSGIDPTARVEGRRRHLRLFADAVAARFGFDAFEAYVTARLQNGMSMAAISREAGLHKDWVVRHLAALAPEARDVAR